MRNRFNTIGEEFTLTLTGGSHSKTIGGIIEGCPIGLEIDYSLLKEDILRRKPQKYGTPRKEDDNVVFLSGVKDNKVVCSMVEFQISNNNVRIKDYEDFKGFFRPSHADYTYFVKYGEDSLQYKDHASARMFLPCVVAGALAKMFLKQYGISLSAKVDAMPSLEHVENGNTIGGKVKCEVFGVKAGWGEPVFYKIQSLLAKSMLSIPSAVSFELGDGVLRTNFLGKEDIDEWNEDFTTKTNHSGGVNAGISNGNTIVFSVGFHPVHTFEQPMNLISQQGKIEQRTISGRHDKAQILRCPVIVEAMAAMVFADLIMMKQKNK